MPTEPTLPAEGTSKEVFGTVSLGDDGAGLETRDDRTVQAVADDDSRRCLERIELLLTAIFNHMKGAYHAH